MFKHIQSRLSYANVAATLALLFAMTGGALAAKHYVITSTGQIKPTVLNSLKGKAGAPGTNGAPGPQGSAGAEGKEGPAGKEGPQGKEGATGKEGSPWTAGGTLPADRSETGVWSFGPEINEFTSVPLSFNIPLAEKIAETGVHFVNGGETAPAGCAGGTVHEPKAAEGNLCVYSTSKIKTPVTEFIFDPEKGSDEPGAGKTGAVLSISAGEESQEGTWAVTEKK